MTTNGDLNNTIAMRASEPIVIDKAFAFRSLFVTEDEDNAAVRKAYRPFVLNDDIASSDWISQLELAKVTELSHNAAQQTGTRLRVLVLFGSLRTRSYSRLLAYEISRILFRLGVDVRVYDPRDLPMKDDRQHDHPKVQELRNLSRWSDGHFWISPEQHGTLTAVFKNQVDWIPLSTGSVRPTQGRTLGMAMVSGGSQSFNTVNSLRILGRWMRMFAIPNQSSIPMAYKQFPEVDGPEGGSRLIEGVNRDRVVDCVEEFVKYSLLIRDNFDLFNDRFSERPKMVPSEADREDLSKGVNGVDLKRL
ncbi:hypothetical protein B0A48_18777 [Cryoendolithus antarcticus]|uniref:NADPH-dependent FMN reductase-like domain-containing protein n=1 Tax=Cryoendolithus antarcticus TaxID=1507870 RepID=A0A1V8S845_9PEZI|nr:hypothetical protein B0A48_18777 [Cryoendolithus antarcticus]